MRPIALNRKNALFAGHDGGAENWACLASLIETCKLHGVDPQAYFADVLAKLVNLWPQARLDELMPWTWAAKPYIPSARSVNLGRLHQRRRRRQALTAVGSDNRLRHLRLKLRSFGLKWRRSGSLLARHLRSHRRSFYQQDRRAAPLEVESVRR
jgi:hypothetical protein